MMVERMGLMVFGVCLAVGAWAEVAEVTVIRKVGGRRIVERQDENWMV